MVRNILGAVTPQMFKTGGMTTEYIGEISSLYFIAYAIGQLINGLAGDKIKARYLISHGLVMNLVLRLLKEPLRRLGGRIGINQVSAAFIFGSHLAFTMAYDANYVYEQRKKNNIAGE